jgi:hypothetical protein
MRPIDRVLARLPDARKYGKSWRVRCPVHHGKSQTSLAISEGDDGRVLLKCHSGCATDDLANTLGLSLADLFDDAGKGKRGSSPSRKPFAHSNTPRQSSGKLIVSNHSKRSKQEKGSNRTDSNTSPRGLTLAQYAEAKKLPLAFLQSLGLGDFTYLGAPAVRIPYLAEDGTKRPCALDSRSRAMTAFAGKQGPNLACMACGVCRNRRDVELSRSCHKTPPLS